MYVDCIPEKRQKSKLVKENKVLFSEVGNCLSQKKFFSRDFCDMAGNNTEEVEVGRVRYFV